MTTLRERTVEDEIADGKRGDLQPDESLLGESGLETDIGLKSFSGDIGFADSAGSIFEDLSPSTALGRDRFATSLENIDQSRVEFRGQEVLEGQVSFGGISTSAESRLRVRSRIEIPKRYPHPLSTKKEVRRVAVKRDVDPLVRLFLRTSSWKGWNNVCGGIAGFTKLHACVAEGCRV